MSMNVINKSQPKTAWRMGPQLAGALALALGCDSQADPGYQGEPLVTVEGRVESALSVGDVEVGVLWLTTETSEQCSEGLELVCTGEATVAVEPSACLEACGEASCENLPEWEACAGACPDVIDVVAIVEEETPFCITGGVGQTTPAVGAFPAQFSLDILEPPPAEALIGSATGERLAYACSWRWIRRAPPFASTSPSCPISQIGCWAARTAISCFTRSRRSPRARPGERPSECRSHRAST